ncbi:MAG: PAS domain-containing protein, partial [Actinomycetes bacterium]
MSAEVDGVEARADGDHLAAGGLLERIVAWAGQVVGTPNGYICLVEPASGEMVLRLGTGAYTGLVGVRMLKREGLSGRVWETGQPLAIPDYSRWDGRVPQIAAENFRAVLGVPLVSGGTVIGVIGLAFSEPGRVFSDDEVTQVSRFAEVASIALDNARLYAAAQQELAERQRAEQRYRTLVDQIPAIVYSEEYQIGGSAMYINPAIEEISGYTAEEMSRKNFWKSTLHPEDRDRVLAEEARCEQTGEPFDMEYRCFSKSGELQWLRDRCVLVRDEVGNPLYWQGLTIDITDIKRALEREQEATQRLRALDRMKNTFLDAVSHELRTPLAAI